MPQTERTVRVDARDQLARRTIEVSAIALGATVLLILLWYIGHAFLIIFGGVLFACALDAAISGLGRIIHLGRGWRYTIVLVLLAAAVGAMLTSWGMLAVQQLADLIATLEQEVRRWRSVLYEYGLGRFLQDSDAGLSPLLPDASGLLTRATTALTGIFGLLGSAVFVAMLGIFFAYDPRGYRDALLRLLPLDKRERVGEVLEEAGGTLRWWLVGIAINMIVVAVFTTLGLMLVGMQHAVPLGVQAGLLAFIPNIGPVVAAIPIILVGFAQSYEVVLWALVIYALVQTVESWILAPLIQMEMVSLYPATILAVQLLMAALYGAAGLALATPLAAVGYILLQRLYVEDILGDRTAVQG